MDNFFRNTLKKSKSFFFFFCYRRDPRKKPGAEPKVLNRRDPRRKNVDSSKQTLHLLPTPVPIAKRSLTPQPTPGILSLPLPSSAPDPFPDPSLSVGSNPTFPLLNRRDPRKRNDVEPAPVPVPAPSSRLQPISRLPSGLSSTASLSSIDSSSGVSRKDPRIRRMKTLPAPTVSTAEGPGEEQMMNIIKNPSRLSVPFKQTESPKSVSKTNFETEENNFTKSLMDMDKDHTSPVYTTSFEEHTISDTPGSDNSRYPAFMASAPPPPDSTPLAPVPAPPLAYVPAPPLASVPVPIPAPPPPVRKISLEKRGDESDSEGELQIDMNPLAGILYRHEHSSRYLN